MKFLIKYCAIIFCIVHLMYAQESTIFVIEKKLTIEEINRKGYTEAVEGLKQIEGLHYTRRGKSSLDLNLRGLSREDINILIDGDKVYGACPNRMDPPSSLILLDNLKSIEIIKGPYDVRNQGSLGGAIITETKDIKLGLENNFKVQTGSYHENIVSVQTSYGLEAFKISFGASYQGYKPYKDGNGNSLTRLYPDFDHPQYFFPFPNTILIDNKNFRTDQLNYEYPQLLPFDIIKAPSNNRFKYTKRNITTEKKTANIKTNIRVSTQQELEIEGYYFNTTNNLTPYLFMDMIWDDFKKGSIKYSIKDINENIKKVSLKIYGNQTLHDMTDELRCNSLSNPVNCSTNELSRNYGMRSFATASVNGARIDVETNLLQKTNFGVDTYLRKWNIETIMRMPFPMNVKKEIPHTGMHMMGGMSGGGMMMGMMQMVNYRKQNSVPQTYVNNLGFYVENEHKFDKIKHKIGYRYDIHSTKAKTDRRILYNIYYPFYDPIINFKYVSFIEAFTIFDAEVYTPQKELKKDHVGSSGFSKWEYELSNDTIIKLSFGYATRFPDPQELYFALFRMGNLEFPDFVGNPLLKPTYNRQIDAGIELKNNTIKLELDAFYSSIGNYIIIRNTPDHFLNNISKQDPLYTLMVSPMTKFYQYINSLITNYTGILTPSPNYPYGRFGRTYKQINAFLYGGEVSLKYQLSKEYLTKVGLSYSRGINRTERTNLPEIPPLKGIASIKYLFKNYFLELEGEFAATQKLVDVNIDEKKTPGWGIGNIYFGYESSSNESYGIKITTGIKNIFNRYYYEHLSYFRDPFSLKVRVPEPGRSAFIQAEIKF